MLLGQCMERTVPIWLVCDRYFISPFSCTCSLWYCFTKMWSAFIASKYPFQICCFLAFKPQDSQNIFCYFGGLPMSNFESVYDFIFDRKLNYRINKIYKNNCLPPMWTSSPQKQITAYNLQRTSLQASHTR